MPCTRGRRSHAFRERRQHAWRKSTAGLTLESLLIQQVPLFVTFLVGRPRDYCGPAAEIVGTSLFYIIEKSLREGPLESPFGFAPPALASFHPRHRAASGRAWWATSLAARPPSCGRLAHSRSKGSQNPHPPGFTLYIHKAKFTKPRPI